MRSTKVRFHLCWSVIVPSTRNKGMVPPMDDSPVRAVRTLPQLPTTLIDLRTAGSSCIYIYIIDVSDYLAHSFLKHWIQKTASLITHHWFYHAISPSILTQNRWSVSPALPLSDASSACRRNLSGNCPKFSFQVVGCWMTMDDLKIQTYPDFGTYPPQKKKNEAPVYEGNSFHSVIVDFFHIWSMFQGTAAIFLGTCDKIVNVWSNMFAF